MGEREPRVGPERVEQHLRALERLPYAPLFFDLTAALDARLVAGGRADLADELALIEERLAELAPAVSAGLAEPGGVGRLLATGPDLRLELGRLLGLVLAALGDPEPAELAGRPLVGADLHLTPATREGMPGPRGRRLSGPLN